MNDQIMQNLRTKESRFKKVQENLDEIKAIILKSNDALNNLAEYKVTEIDPNTLSLVIFGQKYCVCFRNFISSGEIAYTNIDKKGFAKNDLEKISMDTLGNFGEPYSTHLLSEFNIVHFTIINKGLSQITHKMYYRGQYEKE